MRDGWEIVTTVGTDEEAALIAGYLTSREIPAEVESLLFHQEPVTFGRMGEVRVWVPADHLVRARHLLREQEGSEDGEPLAETDES
jgi:hypothetical protein